MAKVKIHGRGRGKGFNARAFWVIVVNAAFVILIIIGVFVAISLLPIKNNYKLFTVMSGSMEPTISTGSVVVVKPSKKYEVNQIITFEKANSQGKRENTTHRLVDVDRLASGEALFTTKGDANKAGDYEQISQSQVLGKVLFSVPLVGYILGYVKTLPGLVLLIIIPATIIIYEEIKKLKVEAKKMVGERKGKKRGFKIIPLMKKIKKGIKKVLKIKSVWRKNRKKINKTMLYKSLYSIKERIWTSL